MKENIELKLSMIGTLGQLDKAEKGFEVADFGTVKEKLIEYLNSFDNIAFKDYGFTAVYGVKDY